MRFGEYMWLHGLWLIPLLGVLAAISIAQRHASIRRFIEAKLLPAMNRQVSRSKQIVKAVMLILSIGFVAVALARPQWDAEPQEMNRSGRDVGILIDVSRSMLAEDLKPNRLERAKLWVRDVIKSVRGDRVAIVAFAGHSVVKAPLTHDERFLRLALDDLSTTSVSRGGTLIGDAIRTAVTEVFDLEGDEPAASRHRDIILITDGEDHDSFPVEAASVAGDLGIRIITIGIGDEHQGRPIPVGGDGRRREYLKHNGETVLTQLDGKTLERIALETPGGKYLNVSTGTVNLDSVYRRFIQEAEQNQMETVSAIRYREHFQIFLAVALLLVMAECMVSDRRRAIHA